MTCSGQFIYNIVSIIHCFDFLSRSSSFTRMHSHSLRSSVCWRDAYGRGVGVPIYACSAPNPDKVRPPNHFRPFVCILCAYVLSARGCLFALPHMRCFRWLGDMWPCRYTHTQRERRSRVRGRLSSVKCGQSSHNFRFFCTFDLFHLKPRAPSFRISLPLPPPTSRQSGLLCYPDCAAGYTGVGPVCWQQCRPGFTDEGALCGKGGSIVPADTSACPWYGGRFGEQNMTRIITYSPYQYAHILLFRACIHKNSV